jgi:hypothetical protein
MKDKGKVTPARHEGVLGSGGKPPAILNIDNTDSRTVILKPRVLYTTKDLE